MSKELTAEHFDEVMGAVEQSFNSLEEKMATKDQVRTLPTRADVEEIVHKATQTMRSDFSDLQTSVDRYTKRTEDWHTGQFALRNRVDRLEKTLVRKQVIREDDLTATV